MFISKRIKHNMPENTKLPHHQDSYQDVDAEPTCNKLSLFPAEMQLCLHQESKTHRFMLSLLADNTKTKRNPITYTSKMKSQIHRKISALP